MSIIRVIVLVACVIVGGVSVGVPFYTAQGIQTNQGGDPLLTTKQLEDAPFVKPEITLPSALKLAEDGLRRKRDLTNYFLQEARLGYSRKNRIEPVWYFKWVKWGVRQSENLPLEVTVSMKGVVATP